MALIRGMRGLCPCPVCLVPNKEQRNVTKVYPLRTAVQTKAVIEEVKSKRTESEKEEILKGQGIRSVSVSVSLLLVISALISPICCSSEGVKCILQYRKF